MPSNTLLKCLTEPNPQVDNTHSLTGRPTEHLNWTKSEDKTSVAKGYPDWPAFEEEKHIMPNGSVYFWGYRSFPRSGFRRSLKTPTTTCTNDLLPRLNYTCGVTGSQHGRNSI
ncbi:hypothetical protein ACO22_01695 [Paracoccidioides brasiliensis]|uniref:Uncharacterized protein n=1 Tax=Paracoccidioides brasiliensis TaxID=121759 RepID=A0A1D2JKU9_PARBR|nr:hypothetical protein ACO22_01695 [Paracoccidioides brasiliensis]